MIILFLTMIGAQKLRNLGNKMSVFKYYNFHLPVYKQGDDLGYCLENSSSNEEALSKMADTYTQAAEMCRALAKEIKNKNISIQADTHFIGLETAEEISFVEGLELNTDIEDESEEYDE
jgi:hypothetical protein